MTSSFSSFLACLIPTERTSISFFNLEYLHISSSLLLLIVSIIFSIALYFISCCCFNYLLQR
nr:MAG TPA: hypothetical protein [Caudoviricetes sp.]